MVRQSAIADEVVLGGLGGGQNVLGGLGPSIEEVLVEAMLPQRSWDRPLVHCSEVLRILLLSWVHDFCCLMIFIHDPCDGMNPH